MGRQSDGKLILLSYKAFRAEQAHSHYIVRDSSDKCHKYCNSWLSTMSEMLLFHLNYWMDLCSAFSSFPAVWMTRNMCGAADQASCSDTVPV